MLFSINPNICSTRELVFDFSSFLQFVFNWSFERLYKLGIVNALNIITLSKGGLPFLKTLFHHR